MPRREKANILLKKKINERIQQLNDVKQDYEASGDYFKISMSNVAINRLEAKLERISHK